MSNITKRFIAGAVCPQCGLQDKTVVFSIGNTNYAECVQCGYKQMAENQKATKQKSQPAHKIIWLKNESKFH